jgi:hypothetical protein
MNFSSQAELVVSAGDSPAVKLKVAALSLTASVVTSMPSFLECLTQFVNAFSRSTPFPFPGRLTGELLRPSELRYLSLFRKTLDTVLVITLELTGKWRMRDVVLKRIAYLLSTPNLAPISVCLALGFSSAYLHISRRFSSVRVLLGCDVVWIAGNFDALSGAAMEGMATGGAECGGP